jgi:hypothetical protein
LLGRGWRLELRLNRAFAQILLDGVARQARAPGNLAIGILSRNAQRRMTLKNPMSITPNLPDQNPSGQRVHMGQFSVKIMGPTGSVLSDGHEINISSRCLASSNASFLSTNAPTDMR